MSHSLHPADRLERRCRDTGSRLCVGLDPHHESLPPCIPGATPAERWRHFFTTLLEALAPEVPVFKPQIAFFEAMGTEGWSLYFELVRMARARGAIVIGDIKRSDIGSTAKAYALAHLGGDSAADFVTLNPYMGSDSIRPFLEVGRPSGRGVFVLARTSNPSGAEYQNLVAAGRTLFEHVADSLEVLGADHLGESGLSDVGAVVGATHPKEAEKLRARMPNGLFLVPGFGAQGATAQDVVPAFRADGTGAVVNSSRGVLFAWRHSSAGPEHWVEAAVDAARTARDQIASALQQRSSASSP